MTKPLSNAQRFFLSRFCTPYPVDAMARDTRWPDKLKRPVLDEVAALKSSGLLKVAIFTPAEALESLSGAQLQKLAKDGSIPYSGKKSVVAARIIEKLPKVTKQVTDEANASGKYVCTDEGMQIAEAYLAAVAAEKDSIQKQMMDALKNGKYLEAVRLHHKFDSEQVFQQGMFTSLGASEGQAPIVKETDRDVAIVRNVFECKAGIISAVPDEAMPTIRIAAAMTYLWGTGRSDPWIPEGFTVEHRLDLPTTIRMQYFHAVHAYNIADLKRFATRGEILSTEGSCEYCRAFAKRKIPLAQFPELPHPGCTSDLGCRCVEVVDPTSFT